MRDPFMPILDSGLIEVIGADEQVDQNDYAGSFEFNPHQGYSTSNRPASGIIRGMFLVSTGGSILQPTGTMLLLRDTDPSVAAGATSITAAEWQTAFGAISVVSGSWLSADANGAIAFVECNVPFSELASIYCVFDYTLVTSFNSDPGDDEVLEVRFLYEVWS